jgi:hypothetical protein
VLRVTGTPQHLHDTWMSHGHVGNSSSALQGPFGERNVWLPHGRRQRTFSRARASALVAASRSSSTSPSGLAALTYSSSYSSPSPLSNRKRQPDWHRVLPRTSPTTAHVKLAAQTFSWTSSVDTLLFKCCTRQAHGTGLGCYASNSYLAAFAVVQRQLRLAGVGRRRRRPHHVIPLPLRHPGPAQHQQPQSATQSDHSPCAPDALICAQEHRLCCMLVGLRTANEMSL